MEKKLAFSSDHAGYQTKIFIINELNKKGYEIKDFGSNSEASCDYPDFAHPMSQVVENGDFNYGISLCGSGNGINMTANKHQKIRSALCWNVEIAELARLHNDANVCSIPARFISKELALEIVNKFLNTDFEGGRHKLRIDKIPFTK